MATMGSIHHPVLISPLRTAKRTDCIIYFPTENGTSTASPYGCDILVQEFQGRTSSKKRDSPEETWDPVEDMIDE